ncbi:MAG: disulfide bond formation protein B [Ilumatobacter sp.]
MDPTTVASLFSVTLLIGLAGGFFAFLWARTRPRLLALAPAIAGLVAVSATLGSLYFSERAGFEPCELCWYQRIAMYPLAVLLPLGAARRDRGILSYAFVLAAIGFVIASYHMYVQWFPETSTTCSLEDSCSVTWVEGLGVFSIPQMAAMAFFLIMMLAVAATFDEDAPDVPVPL